MGNIFKSVAGGGRIEYIDAMRGFTMLLVVCSHVEVFMISEPTYSLNELFGQFRMPLFFFVSGFVFYKNDKHWGKDEVREFFKNKIIVQVLSPLLFMFIHCYLCGTSFADAVCSTLKIGYWFTFVLFEFFVLYILIDRLIGCCSINGYIKDFVWLSVGMVVYVLSAFGYRYLHETIAGLFSVVKILYFFYFVIGTMIRKHWGFFQRVLEHYSGITLIIITFVVLNVFSEIFLRLPFGGAVYTLFTALSGLFLVLAFFRSYAHSVSNKTILGRILQYVGKHTLDIYLLHYFFLESYTVSGLIDFSGTAMTLLQFIICVLLSSVIIAGCLLVSLVIRMSPILGHYLFGARLYS